MTAQQPPYVMADASISHDAEQFRRMIASFAGDGSGVMLAADMAVTQRAAGANMSVDVAGGRAIVAGSEATYQGSYWVENRGVRNVTISAADGTNPRLDLIVARVRDDAYSGASNDWDLIAVTGTPAASPAAPTAPANSTTLARVAVAALATTVVNANITDLRTFYRYKSYYSAVTSYVTTTSFASTGAAVTLPPGNWTLHGKCSYADVGAGGVASNPSLQLWNSTAANQLDLGEVYVPILSSAHRLMLSVLGTLTNTATETVQLRGKEAVVAGAQRTLDQIKLVAIPASAIG